MRPAEGRSPSIEMAINAVSTGCRYRSLAYQIFQLAISFAVIAAPLISGTLGEKVVWHWCFAAAGIGMMVGLATYLAGRRWLP